MCDGYEGVRDYGIVIELLRGNLVEPVTPPTHHVSPQNVLSSSTVIHTSVLLFILLYGTVLYCTVLYSGVFSCQKTQGSHQGGGGETEIYEAKRNHTDDREWNSTNGQSTSRQPDFPNS